jgi:hypothetical protein
MGDEKLTPDSFRPVVEGRSFDLEPELAFRQAALGVLVKYLLVLEAFASSETDADVDKASLELGASIEGLMEAAGNGGGRGAQVSGILATGVDAIGREVMAGQRARALGRVMDASQKDIERLATPIGREAILEAARGRADRADDARPASSVRRPRTGPRRIRRSRLTRGGAMEPSVFASTAEAAK